MTNQPELGPEEQAKAARKQGIHPDREWDGSTFCTCGFCQHYDRGWNAARDYYTRAPDERVRDEHSEDHCHRCGGPNISWAAPSPLWNEVMRGGDINGEWKYNEIICPPCFALFAEEAGITGGLWRFYSENVLMPLKTVTPSGRVWNEKTWLWEDVVGGKE